jgi:hypothetical protein
MSQKWRAPFTPYQRECLRKHQGSGLTHPYTCPNDGEPLVPLFVWVCAVCDYTQDWAHACEPEVPEEDSDEYPCRDPGTCGEVCLGGCYPTSL